MSKQKLVDGDALVEWNNNMEGLDLKGWNGVLDSDGRPVDVDEDVSTCKKYAKLVAPHIGLIIASCAYGFMGAIVFYNVERPHEVTTRNTSLEKIFAFRQELVTKLLNASRRARGQDEWMESGLRHLDNFTDLLYTAYKYEFITKDDFRMSAHDARAEDNARWSMASAVFFSATTMSTIGFGNVVPFTLEGRIICVFFALLGTPLAIITIGDVGKFFSECTIGIYRKWKRLKEAALSCGRRATAGLRRFTRTTRKRSPGLSSADLLRQAQREIEAEIVDKRQVPVALVFGILVIYIALGALLFSILEDWFYVDAFYFCFITLTTVGFGDLVPNRTKYLAIDLLYIGVGLSVTTMCIDLVGIQYIEKIHYFGRKFRGADFLAMLRRRKQLERRLAILVTQQQAQEDDMMNLWIQQQIFSGTDAITSELYSIAINAVPVKDAIVPYSIPVRWPSLVYDQLRRTQDIEPLSVLYSNPVQLVLPDEVVPIKASSEESLHTLISLSSSSSTLERLRMYETKLVSRSGSVESGPSPPVSCSLETPPSVHERTRSSPHHLGSNLDVPKKEKSMDFAVELEQAEEDDFYPSSLHSPVYEFCESLTEPLFPTSTISSAPSSPTESVLDFAEAETFSFPASDSGLSGDVFEPEHEEDIEEPSADPYPELPVTYFKTYPVYSVATKAVAAEQAVRDALTCPSKCLISHNPHVVTENYCFVLDADKVQLSEMLDEEKRYWKPTGRPVKYYFSDDLKKFEKVQMLVVRGRPISARVHRSGRSVDVPLARVYRVCRFYSAWRTCPPFHRIVTVIAPAVVLKGHKPIEAEVEGFKHRMFVQYLWRDAKQSDKDRVALEWNPQASKLMRYAATDPKLRKPSLKF